MAAVRIQALRRRLAARLKPEDQGLRLLGGVQRALKKGREWIGRRIRESAALGEHKDKLVQAVVEGVVGRLVSVGLLKSDGERFGALLDELETAGLDP